MLLCHPINTSFPYKSESSKLHKYHEEPFLNKTIPTSKKHEESQDTKKKKDALLFKTELCENYMKGRKCKYWPKCFYAHGAKELKLTTLMERAEAGLIDIKTYHSRPCFTFASTGSCPLGSRCEFLHDPRVQGSMECWLPKQNKAITMSDIDKNCKDGNIRPKSINIHLACHCHHQEQVIYNGNPFGKLLSRSDSIDEWDCLYKNVCNIKANVNPTSNGSSCNGSRLNEKQRLDITLSFLHGSTAFCPSYDYDPTHEIYGEKCMMIQRLAFDVDSSRAKKINIETFNASNKCHIIACLLVFGPPCSQDVREPSVWFDIDDDALLDLKEKGGLNENEGTHSSLLKSKRTSFDDSSDHLEEPFIIGGAPMDDKDAFNLMLDILRHRHQTVTISFKVDSGLVKVGVKQYYFDTLTCQELNLRSKFASLKRFWNLSFWPASKGRERIHKTTRVPHINKEYIFPDNDSSNRKGKGRNHNLSGALWESFIHGGENLKQTTENFVSSAHNFHRYRLPVFQDIVKKEYMSSVSGESLPMITSKAKRALVDASTTLNDIKSSTKSSDCWKDLLLVPRSQSIWFSLERYFNSLKKRKEKKKNSNKDHPLTIPQRRLNNTHYRIPTIPQCRVIDTPTSQECLPWTRPTPFITNSSLVSSPTIYPIYLNAH